MVDSTRGVDLSSILEGGQTKIWGKASILGVGSRVPPDFGVGGSQGWESPGVVGGGRKILLYRNMMKTRNAVQSEC